MSYSYRSRYRRPPSPVKVGEEHEVTIEEISRRGDGIAKIQGFVIFVPRTKVGDRVKIRITRVSRRYATAERVSARAIEKAEPAIPIHPIKLTSIKGIGIKRAEKLRSCGVSSVQDLANFDSRELSDKLQVSEKRVSKWIDEAKKALEH